MNKKTNKGQKNLSLIVLAAVIGLGGVAWLCADEEAAAEPEVTVQLAKVERATFRSYVTVFGIVETEPAMAGAPAATVTLTAPDGGLISEALAVEGARVAKGDRLFRFDTRLTEVTLATARARLAFALQTLERQKRLAEVDGTSAKNIQEAESQVSEVELAVAELEAQRILLDVVAPIGGVVTRVLAQAGETVGAGEVLAIVKDLDRLVLRASVATREVSEVKVGQAAVVTASFGGQPVEGRIAFVSHEADPQTDTVMLRITLPPGCGLRPGQVATARIVTEERTECLAVPLASLFTERNGTSAISLAKDGKSKKLAVMPGLCNGERVEVKGEGLEAGMQVITVGSYALPDNTKILVRESAKKEVSR